MKQSRVYNVHTAEIFCVWVQFSGMVVFQTNMTDGGITPLCLATAYRVCVDILVCSITKMIME